MARLALVTVGITSHLNSCLALAQMLETAGHTVLLASTRRKIADRVAQEGIQFMALGDGSAVEASGTRQRLRYESALRGEGIEGLVERWQPDLVLVDSEYHAVVLQLLGLGLAPLILEYHIAPRRRPGLPPPTSLAAPGVGALAQLRSAAQWRWLLLRRRVRLALARLRAGGRDEPSAWRDLARREGLDWRATVRMDHWPILTYPQLTHLFLNAGALQFHGHGDDPAYVGPMVQAARQETAHPPAIDEVRRYLARRDGTRPLVACLMGSILSLPDFLRRVRDAAQDADFDLLIAYGKRLTCDDLAPLPENVQAVSYVPQLEVLEAADALVCHGGIATVNEAVLAHVPMLVCSGGSLDEHGNAARVVYHRLGLHLDLARSKPRVLRQAIEALLREPCFREGLERMALAYRRCDDQCLALRRIEASLPSPSTVSRKTESTHRDNER
ncbi:MAG: nucleotide disphospho-sugar-binding domain-containing protein [Pseudomonadota bacterium]